MKYKFNIKSFVMGVLITVLLFSFTGFAEAINKTIDVVVNKVIIKVNGNTVQTDNFLYNGTTYAPMRTVAEMLGKEIQWDGTTYTANIIDPVIQPTDLTQNSRTNPAKIGEKFVVESDDILYGKYKYEITMTGLASGDEAMKIVKDANPFNLDPAEGKEYILAKFKVKLLESEDDNTLNLSPYMFDCVSQSGVLYSDIVIIAGLNPELNTELYKDAEFEGWTYFEVDKTDNPAAVINRGEDGEVWFNLRSK